MHGGVYTCEKIILTSVTFVFTSLEVIVISTSTNFNSYSGFGHLLKLTDIDINHHLITLVEWWKTETHTFHFPLGACIITLENVPLQLGLPINEEPVTGVPSSDSVSIC